MKRKVKVVPVLILIGDEEGQVKKVLQEIQNVKPNAMWPFRTSIVDAGMNLFAIKKRDGETEQFGIVAKVYQDNSCGLSQGNFLDDIKSGYFIVNCVDFLADAKNILQFSEDRSIEVELD